MTDTLTRYKQRGAVAGLIGAVEAALDSDALGPLARARLLVNANTVCRQFDMNPIRQDNESEIDLDAKLAKIEAVLTVGAV